MRSAVQLDLVEAIWLGQHQVGLIRLPRDTAGGDRAGDLVPAWRCCHCGGVELCRYWLLLDHACEPDRCMRAEPHWYLTGCMTRRTDAPPSPYRMDAHWIAPAVSHA